MGQDIGKPRDVLNSACRQKQPVLLTGDGVAITFQTYIVAARDGEVVLENRVKPTYIRSFMASRSYALQAGMIRFQADSLTSDGEHMLFPLKENSVIEETRQAERFAFSTDERVVAEILNPYDNETRLTKSVMDMSATGLSLRTTFDSQLFTPETLLPSVRILIDGELYKQASGRVVYRRRLIDLSGQLRMQVGVKFEA